MAYQAWDSLFIYRNDFILFIKLFPVSAVTVTLRETEAQRDLPPSPAQSSTPQC